MKPSAILRIVLALGLLAWLINRVGHGQLLERLGQARLDLMLAMVVMITIDGWLRAWNWRQLLVAMRVAPRVPYRSVLTCFWSASFLGQVLPSTAGTDALRVMFATNSIGGPTSAHAAAIVMLNIISLFAGCLVGLLCLPLLGIAWQGGTGLRPIVILLFVAAVAGALTAYGVVRWQRGIALRLLRLLKGRRGFKLRRGLRRFMAKLLVFERYNVSPLPVLGIATLTLFTRAAAFALVGAAVHVSLAPAAWLTLVPSIMLSGIVPYSVAGYGGDQAASQYFLTGFGAPAADALLLALLLPLVPMAFNLLGAIPTMLGQGLRLSTPPRP
jgi:uncharacterized membrane protein YbhN (UPF0104 family)